MNSTSELAYGNTNDIYTQGRVHRLIDNGTSLPQIDKGVVTQVGSDALSGDPRVLGFKDANAAERALVISYNYDPSTWQPGDPEFVVCDPAVTLVSGKWPVIKTLTHGDWSQVSNPYGIATIGSAMYIAEYDNGSVPKIDMTGDAYTQSATLFYSFPAVSGNTAHCAGIGVATINNATKIVALFNQGQGYSSYIASTLALIDPVNPDPNPDSTDPNKVPTIYLGPTSYYPNVSGLGQNAISMAVDNGFAYVSSYGGPQQGGGNDESAIEAVNLSNLTIVGTHAAEGDGLGDFVSTVISGTDAFVLRAFYATDPETYVTQYRYSIYKTTTSVLQSSGTALPTPFINNVAEPPASAPGIYPGVTWLLALANGRLWAVLGDRIQGYIASTPGGSPEFNLTTYGASSSSILDDFNGDGHVNTASVVKETTVVMRGVATAASVCNHGARHPAFISHTPEALKLRKKLIEEWQAKKK
ncbi:MAG: hypothetical protein LBP78_08320 [Acidaminococcales bacterium]|jgi:hypothetical protein|nr:hypothetical protein [Acidaminococcales bacterium]